MDQSDVSCVYLYCPISTCILQLSSRWNKITKLFKPADPNAPVCSTSIWILHVLLQLIFQLPMVTRPVGTLRKSPFWKMHHEDKPVPQKTPHYQRKSYSKKIILNEEVSSGAVCQKKKSSYQACHQFNLSTTHHGCLSISQRQKLQYTVQVMQARS